MTEKPERPQVRRRLSREERRNQILDRAVDLFSTHGFDASTRQLATFAGVTQPLLYNYFPSKADLIRAVYERVYLDRWKPEWDAMIADRSRALDQRLIEFYGDYTETIYDPTWLRLYLYSGLKALDINKWYIARVEDRVIYPICREIRASCAGAEAAKGEVTRSEAEALWTFHGGIVYYGIRREIFMIPERTSFEEMIKRSVDTLLDGAAAILGKEA